VAAFDTSCTPSRKTVLRQAGGPTYSARPIGTWRVRLMCFAFSAELGSTAASAPPDRSVSSATPSPGHSIRLLISLNPFDVRDSGTRPADPARMTQRAPGAEGLQGLSTSRVRHRIKRTPRIDLIWACRDLWLLRAATASASRLRPHRGEGADAMDQPTAPVRGRAGINAAEAIPAFWRKAWSGGGADRPVLPIGVGRRDQSAPARDPRPDRLAGRSSHRVLSHGLAS
jgi:hypothetical protein